MDKTHGAEVERLMSDDPEKDPPQDPASEMEQVVMGQSLGSGLGKIVFISSVFCSGDASGAYYKSISYYGFTVSLPH